MELSILLIQQICQLFIMIFFGFLLVRGRVLTAENSKVLSILLLYVACPCAIINSFMIDFTSDKLMVKQFFVTVLLSATSNHQHYGSCLRIVLW